MTEVLGFDVNSDVFDDTITPGTYQGTIESCQVVDRKKDDPMSGKAFQMKVVLENVPTPDGEIEPKRVVIVRYRVPNRELDNPTAYRISGRQLQTLLQRAGVQATADTTLDAIAEALTGVTLQWKVAQPRETDSGTFQDILAA